MAEKISLNKGKRGLVELRTRGLNISVKSRGKYYAVKDIVLQKKVLAALKNYPRGIMASQLANELDLHHQQVMTILDTLVALREAYDLKYGGMKIFFPNGRLTHPVSFQDIEFDNKLYSFSEIIQHLNGQRYIFIQEKERDENNLLQPKGGILLNENDLERFIQKLAQFRDELHHRRDVLLEVSKGR